MKRTHMLPAIALVTILTSACATQLPEGVSRLPDGLITVYQVQRDRIVITCDLSLFERVRHNRTGEYRPVHSPDAIMNMFITGTFFDSEGHDDWQTLYSMGYKGDGRWQFEIPLRDGANGPVNGSYFKFLYFDQNGELWWIEVTEGFGPETNDGFGGGNFILRWPESAESADQTI